MYGIIPFQPAGSIQWVPAAPEPPPTPYEIMVAHATAKARVEQAMAGKPWLPLVPLPPRPYFWFGAEAE